ncbi:hypothetical protein B296_00046643 [Ensete ventricosum]|uniref:Uncharacterized protein n=1 Tax=Ensete ventricosum TaxID=4639 RepID=A0A426XXF4_ENSVE|nr:hypothetical protein B296_00046643 [Ensete ventricosum]
MECSLPCFLNSNPIGVNDGVSVTGVACMQWLGSLNGVVFHMHDCGTVKALRPVRIGNKQAWPCTQTSPRKEENEDDGVRWGLKGGKVPSGRRGEGLEAVSREGGSTASFLYAALCLLSMVGFFLSHRSGSKSSPSGTHTNHTVAELSLLTRSSSSSLLPLSEGGSGSLRGRKLR